VPFALGPVQSQIDAKTKELLIESTLSSTIKSYECCGTSVSIF
jgi:hypothetical protein